MKRVTVVPTGPPMIAGIYGIDLFNTFAGGPTPMEIESIEQ